MKKITLITFAALAFTGIASAQLSVQKGGRVEVGPFKAEYDRPSLDSLLLFPTTTAADSPDNGISPMASKSFVSIDKNAALTVLGRRNNVSGGYIAFGNDRNVTVGEWAGREDSDILQLRGIQGLRFESGNAEIFKYYCSRYSDNATVKFIFNCDVKGPAFLVTSDERLKSDIEDLDVSTADFSGINPISYRLKAAPAPARAASATEDGCEETVGPAAPDPRTRYGFSAQEVKEIFPDLVCEDEDGYLSVDYIGFIPILVDAVKSLKAEVEEQKSVIESLTARENAPQRAPGKDGGQAGIDGPAVVRPSLAQNRPNPFTATTVIECTLPESVADASLRIYDLQGKQVMKLAVEGRGSTSVTVDGSTLAAGMYIYALIADGRETDSKRMILTD